MGRSNAGYTKGMNKIGKYLRKLGLPNTLFDADFAEKENQNKRDAEMLLERMRERERNGAYEGLELPWTELRKQYEADILAGKEVNYTATQPVVPNWKRSLDIAAYIWKSEVQQLIERQERKQNKK